MDLRWGIREQSHDDHTIIEFCLREIDRCKTKSIGPNFVVSVSYCVARCCETSSWCREIPCLLYTAPF